MTQLAFRGEAGAVIASQRDGIPSVFLFRTGGDTTVRGYAYQSLGLPRGDAVVGGRYLAIGSAEAIRWINETWGVAAFVDVGDAFDDAGAFDPALGVGLGARLRTPIGPFRLDVAYGERTKEVRLHFSVGVTF
jgi:translocation and assembly module TamA